jgi:hypothetical protein
VIISSLSILSAVQAVMAVAVAMCRPATAAIASSPMKSPAERRVMVASLPALETTVSLARPFCR